MKKKAQAGIEYMIIVGFVTFAILTILVLATSYSEKIKDQVLLNQVESFVTQLLNSAESVYFAGEPSKIEVSLYLPEKVKSIIVTSTSIIISTTTSTGENIREYKSRVPLNGSITSGQGIKKLSLEATEDFLNIRKVEG